MSIKVVELFAGVGGFRVGLERSSDEFVFVWANQWEPGKKTQHAFDCYVKHFGNSENHVNEDISKVKDQIPDHDLLVGGFLVKIILLQQLVRKVFKVKKVFVVGNQRYR
jgi:DNA (cytosine-5)-methyltransferase 1